MKNILIISYSPLHTDPRVLRQVKTLREEYKISTIGFTQIKDNNIIYYQVKMPNKRTAMQKIQLLPYRLFNFKRYIKIMLEYNLDLKNILSQNIYYPDVIIANDWNGLYLASVLKTKHEWQTKVYFDAHEYSPNDNKSLKWRFLIRPVIINILKKCKSDIAIMTTVCDGIAREYERFFDFSDGFVGIVTNAAEYNSNLQPSEIGDGDIIRLIHHGGAMQKRRLELMIKMMEYLDPDKYELTFMLVKTEPEYYNYLVEISRTYKNIKFIEPVSFSEIVSTLNRYDIGVFLLLPEIYNYKYALPNKLFEFIQARLAVAIGPSIEMMKIVNRYNLGVHSEKFTPKSLANNISAMAIERIMEYKRNADKHARELSAETNMIKIKEIIAELTEN